MAYGKEVIIDLYACDVFTFSDKSIEKWKESICNSLGLKRVESNITIHKNMSLCECYINIFSRKQFDGAIAVNSTKSWFASGGCEYYVCIRGQNSKEK